MSTAIKPLNVYIGGTKVFPDINTAVLDYSIYNEMYEDTEILKTIHKSDWRWSYNWFDNYNWNHPNALVLPIMEDTDDSPWHTNSDIHENYWCFDGAYGKILSIPFTINQNWIADWFSGTSQFKELSVSVLNFNPTTSRPSSIGYDENDHSVKTVDVLNCNEMFGNCRNLKEIHGLNLGGTRDHLIDYQSDASCYSAQQQATNFVSVGDLKNTYSNMFMECNKLTTLDITWPDALSGTDYPVLYGNCSGMFYGCAQLQEAQIPTFALRPVTQGDTLDIGVMFSSSSGSHNMTYISSLHITADSWPYIANAGEAWAATAVTSIDIPATATNLSYVKNILGQPMNFDSIHYTNSKYIIRTEKPMADYLNDSNEDHVKLFDFDNYNDNQDFLDTFGGIYVPDSQLTAWKTYISNAGGANIATDHVFGLSDL